MSVMMVTSRRSTLGGATLGWRGGSPRRGHGGMGGPEHRGRGLRGRAWGQHRYLEGKRQYRAGSGAAWLKKIAEDANS